MVPGLGASDLEGVKGSFWTYVPATEWPFKLAGGCVHGRFDVTDADQ